MKTMSAILSDSDRLSKIVAFLIIIFAVLGSSVFFLKVGTETFIKGVLFICVPLLLPAIIVIYKPELFESKAIRIPDISVLKFRDHITFNGLFLLFYILSIYLVYPIENRTLEYFFLVTIMGGLLLLEIRFFKFGLWTILIQEMALLINITFSYTLKHSTPIFTTDIFFHMHLIEIIAKLGYLHGIMGNYENWPMFHIINSIGLILTNLELSKSYFILNGLCFVITALFLYLIVNYVFKDIKFSLLTVLVYIFLRPVEFECMDMITRSSCYVFCIILLYLMIRKINNAYIAFLSVALIIPIVLTHQTTLAFFLTLLFLICIIEKIISVSNNITIGYLILFIISIFAYWFLICGPVFDNWLHVFFSAKDLIYIAKSEVIQNEDTIFSIILKLWDYLILLFVATIGVFVLLREKPTSFKTVLSLVSIIVLPLIHPNISALFLSSLGYRWPIMVSPFVAIIAAAGFYFIIFKANHIYLKYVFVLLILSFFLASSAITGYYTDFEDYQKVLGKTSRSYLLDSELNSFNFILDYNTINYNILSDYVSEKYLKNYVNNTFDASSGLSYELVSSSTYLIFRDMEYRLGGILYFTRGKISTLGFARSSEQVPLYYDINPNPHLTWSSGLKIYNSNSVSIYFKQPQLNNLGKYL